MIGNFRAPHSTENELRVAHESLGTDLIRVQEDAAVWGDIASAAKAQHVDFVQWVHTHYMAPESAHDDCQRMLDQLRAAKIPCVGSHLDRWWGLIREHQIRDEPYFRQSLLCTADGGHDDDWAALGINHAWFPPAVSHIDAEREVDSKRELRIKRVGFVGSWQTYHEEWPWRRALVLWLRRTFQHNLALYPKHGKSLRGRELNVLYQSVPVLVGDSCLAGGATRYWSDRIPETLGRGGFLLHPNVVGLDDFFVDGEHFVAYEPFDYVGIKALIDRYNNDPQERLRIAKNGREAVRDAHTYRHRMTRLYELVNNGLADWQ